MLRAAGLAAVVIWGVLDAVPARAECFGEYPYRVCTDTYTSPSGDISIRSYDTLGNTYSLDTRTRRLPGGGNEITSTDSMGNSYSVRSWCDATGCHSTDSMGNRCTITRTGQLIGC